MSACTQEASTDDPVEAAESADAPVASEAEAPVAKVTEAAPDADGIEEPSAFAQTIPTALLGKWRETSGPAPTAAQCDGYVNSNMGKVLTIREDGYSYFETGGRLLTVSDRSPGMIRANFDTTYADEQTRDEMTFKVDPVAKTLTSIHHGADKDTTLIYKRCPG